MLANVEIWFCVWQNQSNLDYSRQQHAQKMQGEQEHMQRIGFSGNTMQQQQHHQVCAQPRTLKPRALREQPFSGNTMHHVFYSLTPETFQPD